MSIIGAAPAADEARSGPVLDIVDAPPSIRVKLVGSSSLVGDLIAIRYIVKMQIIPNRYNLRSRTRKL
jgi:hypothetical protein